MDAARAVFESMQDPPSGVAAAGNHPVDRHPKHQHHSSPDTNSASGPVFREPSTWDTMIRCELAAGENERAVKLMRRVDERAFPDAGEFRCPTGDPSSAELTSLLPQSPVVFASCCRTSVSRLFLPLSRTRRHHHDPLFITPLCRNLPFR